MRNADGHFKRPPLSARSALLERAQQRLEDAREQDTQRADSWWKAGRSALEAGLFAEAADALREYVRLRRQEEAARSPDDPFADLANDGASSSWALPDLEPFRTHVAKRTATQDLRIDRMASLFLEHRLANLDVPRELVAAVTIAEAAYVARFARTHANHGERARLFDEALAAWYAAQASLWVGDDSRACEAHERATSTLAAVADPSGLPRSGEVPELIPCLRGMAGLFTPVGSEDAGSWEAALDEAIACGKLRNKQEMAFLRLRVQARHDPEGEAITDFRRAFPQLEHLLGSRLLPLA